MPYGDDMDDLFGRATNITVGVTNMFACQPRRQPVQGGFESCLYPNFDRPFFASTTIELQAQAQGMVFPN